VIQRTTPVPPSGRRRALAAVATALLTGVLVLSLGVTSPPAVAQDRAPSAAELGITTEVAFGRGPTTAGWNLVTVTASPSVPIRGRLELRASGPLGTARADVPLEVAAGATRVAHVLLPPTEDVSSSLFHADGAQTRVRSEPGEGTFAALVAGLGSAPTLPTPLNTAGTDRAVTGVALDQAVLDLGPAALDPLSAVVLSATELAQLQPAQRNALEGAVLTGLSLVVTVEDGDAPEVLGSPLDAPVTADLGASAVDGAWLLTDGPGDETVGAWQRRGLGSVAVVRGSALDASTDSRALWTSLVQLRPELADAAGSQHQWGGDVFSSLFGGRAELPGTLPFLLFGLAFLVLVGPVNGAVLGRLGRRELAWVTVPVITLVFTVGAAVAASTQATSVTPTVRAAWWLDGGGQEITVASVQAPRRGTVDVVVPGRRTGIAGTPWSSTQSLVLASDTSTTLRVSLESLQQASAVAWGDPAIPPPFDVTAEVRDGVLEVEVVNTTQTAFDEVEVRFATSASTVGRLDAGARVNVRLDELDDGLPRARPVLNNMMRGGMMQDLPAADGEDDPGPGTALALLEYGPLSGAPGTVWVTGSARDDLGLAVPEVGGALDDRGTVVAVGAAPTHVSGAVLAHEVQRDLLRTWQWMPWREGPLQLEVGGQDLVLRYRLPAPLAEGTLVSTLLAGGDPGRNMDMRDPWMADCFAVERFDDQGEPLDEDPEERCGPDAACPPQANVSCFDDGQTIEACYDDGTCQRATPIFPAEQPDADGSAFEVWDHAEGRWLPYSQAFDEDGIVLRETIVSPLGEVLVRVRTEGMVDLSRRGLEVRA
jgi:hypothetical protein